MGRRGPPPEPTVFRELRGNPSKRPFNIYEPKPDEVPEDFPAPDWLEGEARGKWEYVIPILVRMKVMTEADVETIARYCALWEQWKINYDHVKAGHGVLPLRDDKGNIKYLQTTPYASQMRSLARELLRIEQEFGLTPSSRSQVAIHANKNDDPLMSFAQSRGDRARA